MNNWALVAVAVLLLAVTIATIAYVRYRRSESTTLARDADLAVSLRTLAGDDAVRLAAVDEFEIGIYERLFYSRAIGAHARSAAWAVLGAALAAGAAVVLDGIDGTAAEIVWVVSLVAAGVFALAAVIYVALAVFAALVTPRVSFTDSFEADEEL